MSNIYSLKDQGLSSPEQKSPEWFEARKGRITGSKPADLYFNFKQESDWDYILNKWFGEEKEDFDAVSLRRMAWGSKHEDSAMHVIVDNIPGCHFFDCPMIPIDEVYASSPDGFVIVLNEESSDRLDTKQLKPEDVKWSANVEIKCPGGGIGKTPEEMREMVLKKWKRPAAYYMMQVHMEMVAQKSQETLFVVWTPLLTRMWRVPFDHSFWELCKEVLDNFRLKNIPFEVMMSKVQTLKRRCFGVSNVPIFKEIHHSPSE